MEENRLEARAHLKYARISPRKVKIVCDLIRGKNTKVAKAILEQTPNIASEIMLKLLNSVVANAEHNHELDPDILYVSEIFANPGPVLKRIRSQARGRAYRIRKRTTHITIIVAEKE